MRDRRRPPEGRDHRRPRRVERSIYRGGCVSWFPQTGAGSIAQYPIERARTWRLISNVLENGERISLPDDGAAEILWDLTCEDLTDTESGQLRALFRTMQGSAKSFLYVDPLVNLLGWIEDR